MQPHATIKGQLTIERMSRSEVQVAIDWAQKEGWNPGVHDAECFYRTDPDGFYAARLNGEIIGTVSMIKYSADFAFVGLFIVKPQFRGQGVGLKIQRFIDGISGGLNVGLDGVVLMQTKYQRHGFKAAFKSVRYQGTAKSSSPTRNYQVIKPKDFSEVASFDAGFFPAKRERFLKCWLFQKDSTSLMIKDSGTGQMLGYGTIRKCSVGHKVGPLFAKSQRVAEDLFEGLNAQVPGEQVFLDTPLPNQSALQLAKRHMMEPVFETVRMYTKAAPALPLENIYGVTTFELG